MDYGYEGGICEIPGKLLVLLSSKLMILSKLFVVYPYIIIKVKVCNYITGLIIKQIKLYPSIH